MPERSAGSARAVAADRHQATVLVVDDQDDVRSVVADMLVSAGYSVVQAHDAATAHRAFATARPPVDLVLSDVVMPDVGGPELVESLRRERSELRVLLMSGYADLQPDAPRFRGFRVLRKPVGRAELLAEVAAALDVPMEVQGSKR